MPVERSTPGADAPKEDVEKAFTNASKEPQVVKRRWYGKRVVVKEKPISDAEEAELEYGPEKRPTMLYAPLYNGIAAGLSLGKSPRFV